MNFIFYPSSFPRPRLVQLAAVSDLGDVIWVGRCSAAGSGCADWCFVGHFRQACFFGFDSVRNRCGILDFVAVRVFPGILDRFEFGVGRSTRMPSFVNCFSVAARSGCTGWLSADGWVGKVVKSSVMIFCFASATCLSVRPRVALFISSAAI